MERGNQLLSRHWTTGVLLLGLTGVTLWWFAVSRHRIIWSDELFGWFLLADPSWRHMFRAWKLGADGGGLGFYVLGRIWLGVFGHTALSFRAYSAAGVFVGFAAAWFSMRRYYREGVAALCLITVWFGCQLTLWQTVQTRFYGLLLAAAACALCAEVASAEERSTRRGVRPRTVLLVFTANVLLVSTHPLGVMYSGTILLGGLLHDLVQRRARPLVYAGTVLPWSLLWFSREAMRNSAAVGKPWFWTTRPSRIDLRLFYTWEALPWMHWAAIVFLSVTLLWPARRRSLFRAFRERGAVLFPGLLLSAVPVLVWVISHRGTSVFVDRYLIPSLLGVAIIGAEAWTQLFPRSLRESGPVGAVLMGAGALALLSAMAWEALYTYPREIELPPYDFTQDLARMLPRNVPVVFERVDMFDVMQFYRGAPDLPLFFVLDWPTAVDPASPRGLVSGEHEMENWRKAGYFADRIVDQDEFLAHTPHFMVVDSEEIPWREHQIANRPEWRCEKVGTFVRGPWTETIWEIQRR